MIKDLKVDMPEGFNTLLHIASFGANQYLHAVMLHRNTDLKV